MARIAVVGGGISGLAAAHALAANEPQHMVMLVERAGRLGGKIGTHRLDGYLLEEGPESFLSRKPAGVELCRELGISERLIGRSPRGHGSFIYHAGRLHPLPEGFSGLVPADPAAIASTELLSEEGKRRLLQEPEIPPAGREPDEESVAQFMGRRFGTEAFERMIEPLLCGIFAGDAHRLSMEAAFPQLFERERRFGRLGGQPVRRKEEGGRATVAGRRGAEVRGRPGEGSADSEANGTLSGAGTKNSEEKAIRLPPFVSFADGMGELVGALAGALPSDRLLTGVGVRQIRRKGRGFSLLSEGGEVMEADAVVLATPPAESARLLGSLSSGLATAHAAIPSASTVVVHLGFRERELAGGLDGYGYIVPSAAKRTFHACTWSSSKWPGRAPEGRVLLRLYGGRYGGEDPDRMSDGEIIDAARAEVSEVLGASAAPSLVRLVRWPQAIPQYNLGHRGRLSAIEKELREVPGLFLAGAAYRGVGIPDCIESGRAAAAGAAEHLRRR